MQMTLHRFDLPLRHVFTTAHGSQNVYRALVVELEQDGRRGFGEAGQSAYYGQTCVAMAAVLERLRPRIEAQRLDDPAEFWDWLDEEFLQDRFAQSALDCAGHDLWGKLRGEPVWKLWGQRLENCPPSDYTIGIDSIEAMVAKLRECPGWPAYKIKLATMDDLAIVAALRAHTDAVFRVDANCGWTAEETIRNSLALRPLGVEFIEQPLQPDDWDGMRAVYTQSALPIIADESCRTESDVDRCQGFFHGINIKLGKCGGLRPARRMIDRARQLGLRVMAGCMCESTVGISAVAQLLPLLDDADMDGAMLLGRDIAEGVRVERGRAYFPACGGCGITLLADAMCCAVET
jgi:L-alanine-DL-glutamate epimerase-like enolase superfamily enzyme